MVNSFALFDSVLYSELFNRVRHSSMVNGMKTDKFTSQILLVDFKMNLPKLWKGTSDSSRLCEIFN